MQRLLVVDDEANVRYSLEKGLSSPDLEVITAATAQQGINLVRQQSPNAVLLDVRLPDMSGLDAFDQIRQLDKHLPVIVITAFAATETAIEAMKRGAFEYLLKPVDLKQLREVVRKALEVSRMSHVPALFEEEPDADVQEVDRIVGRSSHMQEVYKEIGRLASRDVTVLILGESGTGKELVARALYQHSHRADRRFLAINCAAIPEALLESELFGHEKGAFTGADRRRVGVFEQCDGGTLFLDEIGDMSPATQAKVLRVLQDQHFQRLGSTDTIRTDVRLIAATNQLLPAKVDAGEFRGDLYYRLNGFTIQLPPLRERREDIPFLVDHFLRRFNRELSLSKRGVTEEARKRLLAYSWPGNVREFQSAIRYAVLHCKGEVLDCDSLPEVVRGDLHAPAEPSEPADSTGLGAASLEIVQLVQQMLQQGESEIYEKINTAVDRVVLTAVLSHTRGSQAEASQLLGMSRTTLRAKLRQLGLTVEKHLSDSDQLG